MKKINFLVLFSGILFQAQAYAQDAAFYICEDKVKAYCQSLGTPNELHYWLQDPKSPQGYSETKNYPAPPSWQTSGVVTYFHSCLFHNAAFPQYPGLNYQYGIFTMPRCSYNLDPVVKPVLAISNLRIAQRVFEPSISDGATTDLVTLKPFAVEVTLSATVPDQYKLLKARVEIWIGGKFANAQSPAFEIGKIESGQSKAFAFHQIDVPGPAVLEIRVVPVEPKAGIFEDKDSAVAVRPVIFHDTSLSLLVSEITGCSSNISDCFTAPYASERTFLEAIQIPFAEKIMPISGGKLSFTNHAGWSESQPGSAPNANKPWAVTILKDAMNLWLEKKMALKDLGLYLVGDDYFLKHGLDKPNQIPTLGYVLSHQTGVQFAVGRGSATVAHELIHNLWYGIPHSSEKQVEGIGLLNTEIWTTGKNLDPNVPLGNLAADIYFESSQNSNAYSVNRVAYNYAFKALTTKQFDPKVILVAGVIGSDLQPIYFETRATEANLDPQIQNTNLVVEGLDRSGKLVSSVQTILDNQAELIKESGPNEMITSDGSIFTATLPDDGSIINIRVVQNSQILFMESAYPLSLQDIIDGLNADCLVFKPQISTPRLIQIQNEYRKYLKFKDKNDYVAKLTLNSLKDSLLNGLKNDFFLTSGAYASMKKVIDLLNAEISKIP